MKFVFFAAGEARNASPDALV